MKKILLSAFLLTGLFFLKANSHNQGQPESVNSVQLIRNATLKMHYAGRIFLVDPMFSDKDAAGWSVVGVNKNPRVRLTMPIDSIMKDVDFALVTHNHGDHFDKPAADAFLKKNVRLYVQPIDSSSVSQSYSCKKVIPVADSVMIGNITVIRTGGVHGLGKVGERCGQVSGFIIKSDNAPVVYVTGDVVYNDEIKKNIRLYNPDYIISNSGGAIFPDISPTDGPLIMDERQTVDMVRNISDKCKVIAVHMEAIDHCQTTRSILRNEADHAGISHDKLLIPDDGEVVDL